MRAKPSEATSTGRRVAGLRVGGVTVAVALAVAAGVLGTAWALQAATLPPPDPGHVVAARAMSWLTGNRLVESTFVAGDGSPGRSTCSGKWLTVGGAREQVALLAIEGSPRAVVPVGRPYLMPDGSPAARPTGPDLARLELAGCPPVLESLIAGLARRKASTPVGRARIAGRSALTLRIWTRAGRLTVFLETDSHRPFALAVAGPHLAGTAQLRLTEPSARTAAGGA